MLLPLLMNLGMFGEATVATPATGGGTSRRKLKRRLKRRLPEHELELDPIAAMALPAVAPGPMLDEQDDEDEELKLIIALRALH